MGRKFIFTLAISAIMLCLLAPPSYSGRYSQKKSTYEKHYKNRHTDVLHMYLTDENGNWALTHDAPKGKLKYNLWGDMFDFSFKGIKLTPDTDYTLVYYWKNAYETYDFLVLGDGLTDHSGHIYFENTLDTCSMPSSYDSSSDFGARILLVPSDSIENNEFIYLNQETDLEGSHLIRFYDTDGCDSADNEEPAPPVYIPPDEEPAPPIYIPPDEEPDPPVYIPPPDDPV